METIARFALDNGRFLALLVVAVIAAGTSTYLSQPRQEDPEITIRVAQVMATFPGMSPERVEQLITRPLEEEIKRIPEVKEIKSVSMTGVALIMPELHDRYFDLDPIWADLRNKMDDIAPSLPDGTQGPFVNDDFGRVAVITLAVHGDDYSARELRWAARELRDELAKAPLVARIDLYGVQEERVWLEMDAMALTRTGLTPDAVVSALRAQNVVLPGGAVKAGRQSIVIEPTGNFESVEDIRDLAIEAPGGLVYLRDLVTVRRGYVDPPERPVLFDGAPAVVLAISMVSGSNISELGRDIEARLGTLRQQLPLGLELDVVTWQPELVEAAVWDATENLGQTIGIVLLVVVLFLGLRTGLIVGAMVPLTVFASLVGMNLMGIELHRVSIAAVIVALGLLVDNGIVVVEDVKTRMAKGAARRDAALEAVRTLGVPLLTSSLTTILAFMPLMLAENTSGEYLRALSIVITLTLLASWLISLTVTPAMCVWFLPDAPASEGTYREPPGSGIYRKLLGLLLRARLVFVVAMILLLVGSLSLFGMVKQRHMAPSERNQFVIYLNLPAGSATTETVDVAGKLSAYLTDHDRNPEILSSVVYVASGGPRFFLALQPPDAQDHIAFGIVTTQDDGQVEEMMERVDGWMRAELPEATGRTEELFLGPAPLGTVELRIHGPELDELQRLAEELQSVFRSVPGTMGVRSDWENPVLKVRSIVDQERARRAGVTSEEIARALSMQVDGLRVTDYREGDKVVPVVLRAEAQDRESLDRLRTLEVFSSSRGVGVPLLQVADFEGVVEPSQIRRVDQERAVTVAGKHFAFSAKDLYARMEPVLDRLALPEGYRIETEGEIKASQEANGALFLYAPHCLAGIVALLVLQFGSFRKPAIVGLTIPLILIGAVLGLLLFRAWFDFVAMLGLFSLAGIIINNGIVLIDRIDQERERGLAVDTAITEAAVARMRPIVMTTLTTILGLVPLALLGGEFWFGMAIVIMSGLAVGTVLTLGVVPVLYSLLFRRNRGIEA
ncbi:MAG: efflux RND transporter permease subunit [Pseudomonadales bacterium]|jgi:multidrug efflux pump subunit AcrB|nr:efflux RND transporter permease subunit [Pseudomonadales bacterium]